MTTTTLVQNDPLAAVEAMITSRRSVKEFLPQPVPRAVINRLLNAAVWAPNHRLTEPWRFYVLDGASRTQLGEVARELTLAQLTASGGEPAVVERKAAEAGAAWSSVPALIYITVQRNADPELDLENYGAACCAAYALMLAAHAAGLATSWSSGAVAASAGLQALAGADPSERLVGLFRIGYPAASATSRTSRRTPGHAHTTWIDGPTA